MNDGIERSDPIRAARVVTLLDEYLSQELSTDNSKLPKYIQLQDALIRAIEKGVVVEGDKLPSEAELTSISPYSLGTVQKALKTMMDSGLVVRKPGVGTIIRRLDHSMRQPLHSRFSKSGQPFLPVYPKLLSRQVVTEYGAWTDILGKETNILRLDSRIVIGDEFSIVTNFYIDSDKFPFFAERSIEEPNTENYKSLVQEETKRRVTRLDHKISFSPVSDDLAALIDVEPNTQVMKIKSTAWDQSDEAVYYQVFFIPPNELDLTIESLL